MEKLQNNLIVQLTFKFALDIMDYSEKLEGNRKYITANQLFKSGTSIGANIREAQNAESKSDFIHKMKIAAKEAEETDYWLQLCKSSNNYPDCDQLIEQMQSIIKILNKIISTSKSTN
jgi:four helix bundle protein